MNLIPLKKKVRLWLEIMEAALMRSRWPYVVVHRKSLTTLDPKFAIPLLCGPAKGRLRCPENLTILLAHNYPAAPVMEQSLRYAGINDFHVLHLPATKPWNNTAKLRAIHAFLDNGGCTTDYVLYCDSNDAVIRSDPSRAVALLDRLQCELLFSTTSFPGGFECMLDVKQWAEANDSGIPSAPYLNSGVYVGRTEFVGQVVAELMHYVSDDELAREEYGRRRGDGTLCQRLPEYPKNVGSDQVIFRYLHRQFFPRMRVDPTGFLALR